MGSGCVDGRACGELLRRGRSGLLASLRLWLWLWLWLRLLLQLVLPFVRLVLRHMRYVQLVRFVWLVRLDRCLLALHIVLERRQRQSLHRRLRQLRSSGWLRLPGSKLEHFDPGPVAAE